MSNKNYHHGALKEALVCSARKILTDQGADALSLRVIASDVGVSHMAPYSHFKNKKELVQAIAASGFNELTEKMLSDSQALNKPQDLILAYGVTYIEFAIEHPQLYRLMLGQVETSGKRSLKTDKRHNSKTESTSPIVSLELEASSNRPFDLLHDAFFKALKTDDALTVKAQALGAWSMVHGMAALIIEGHFSIPDTLSVKDFLALATVKLKD